MSIWYYKKEKSGKSSVYSITAPVELILLVLFLLFGLLAPRYFMHPRQFGLDPMAIIIIGFSLFFASKVSLFLRGVWNSWGPKNMKKPFRWLYYGGYMLMISGCIGTLLSFQII